MLTKREELTGDEYLSWKRYETLPPFHCTVEFAESIKEIDPENNEEYKGLKEFGVYVSKTTNQDINKYLRLIEVEEDLIPLIVNTDNKIFYRKLFFPYVFLNNDIEFEHVIVKGMLICDENKDEKNKDFTITALCLDLRDYGFYTIIFNLVRKLEDRSLLSKDDIDFSIRLNDYLRNIICNFVDLVEGNDEDIDLVEIRTNKEQNEKRIKRGKIPLPTKVFIKAKKEFKQYVKEFNHDCEDEKLNEKLGFDHKFLVIGHFRHFRDERYINVKGSKIWIKPFWKGGGIIINKDYKVINNQ